MTRAGAPPDFTRPDQPATGWGVVEYLADDRLGQPARLKAVIPLGAGGELVRDEPAEWPGIEVLRMPGRQPQAGQVIAPCPPRSTSPPLSFVDHRVPPVACPCQFPVRTARTGRSLSERRREPGPGYIRFVIGSGPGRNGLPTGRGRDQTRDTRGLWG